MNFLEISYWLKSLRDSRKGHKHISFQYPLKCLTIQLQWEFNYKTKLSKDKKKNLIQRNSALC